MKHLRKLPTHKRMVPTLILVAVVLLASWMGGTNGGYFVSEWALVILILATLALIASVAGAFHDTESRWSIVALILFAAYTAWTLASLLWSPNLGDAWIGAGQTLLYLDVFWLALSLVSLGASRRWVLVASVLGPAVVAAFTMLALVTELDTLFDNSRLIGTVGYYNGEAAFLLVPFWVAVYLAGSQLVHPVVRGLILAGASLSAEVAVLTQSRGLLVAMAVSLPVFFALSGQRLRGFLALLPVSVALLITFPDLNGVYLAFRNDGDPTAVLERVVPVIWWTSVVAGLYGLFWGAIDRWWRPSVGVVRVFGVSVPVTLAAFSVVGVIALGEQVRSPVAWATEEWEAFKTDSATGQEQSRYLSASGSGRYTLWQVAWKDFVTHPLFGVGTHNYEATYYQLRERSVGYVRQPHSLPLEVLGERGVVGGVLFFGFLGICLADGLRRRFKHLDAESKASVGAMVAAVAYWFVHSAADWFWQLPAVTLPVIIYLAMLATSRRRVEAEPPKWPMRAGIALGAVLIMVAVAPLYVADQYLARSYATMNPWVALEDVESAQRFNPVDPQLPQREAELALQIGNWPRVEKAYDRAIQLNPEHYAPYTLLARFYEQRGESEKALSLYRKALALNPLDEELNQSVKQLGRV